MKMVTTVRAADVCAYILAQKGPVPQIVMHKLLYYCQAGSLVWDNQPLFRDRIEAWINGPVVPAIWNLHRYEYKIESEKAGDWNTLGRESARTVDSILRAYGNLPPYQLVQLTHGERPWREARMGLQPNERGDAEITHDSMRSFYSEAWR